MLWRRGYQTEVLTGCFAPGDRSGLSASGEPYVPCAGEVWVGSDHLAEIIEQEFWLRLFESEYGRPAWLRRVVLGNCEAAELAASVAPSWHSSTFTVQGIAPVQAKVFCWHLESGTLMLGPATEEAWDQMRSLVG